jgi:hypothetical protein
MVTVAVKAVGWGKNGYWRSMAGCDFVVVVTVLLGMVNYDDDW